MWNLELAVELCKKVESVCPTYGCHVALTGGTLYKTGERKDCDLLFYRIRQTPKIDWDGLFFALENIGFYDFKNFGWVTKVKYKNLNIDIFNPEYVGTGSQNY